MRITSGQYRGRRVEMPKGICPTQSQVRKAIFDILGDISGENFLELFAGSGAVGLEAVSRGAKEAVLVENSRESLLIISKNIEHLKALNCKLLPRDSLEAIKFLHKDKRIFDIIFLDPPYYEELSKKTLQTLEAYDILAPNGFLVVQHFKRDVLPEESPVFGLIKEAKYGDTILSFYRKTT